MRQSQGWITGQLSDFVESVSTGPFGSILHKRDYITGGIPVINPVNLVAGKIAANDAISVADETADRLAAYRLQAGDILIARRGDIGRCGMVEAWQEGWLCGTGCFYVRPSNSIDPGFLTLLIGSPEYRDKLIAASTGTTMLNISNKTLASLPMEVPPLEEQKRIVAVLDQAFAALDRARANAEANLADAEELLSQSINAAFDDLSEERSQPLSQLIAIGHGFAFKSKDFSDVDDDSLPIVLTPGNYAENATLYFREGKTRRLASRPPPEFLFAKGELTIVMTDLSSKMKILGKPAFVDRDGLLHNQRIGRIRFLDESLSPRFLYYFMRTSDYLKKIRDTATGTMVRHTAPKRILDCQIPLPSLDVQEQIVERIGGIEAHSERLALSYTESIDDTFDLRQSILLKAFAGELT